MGGKGLDAPRVRSSVLSSSIANQLAVALHSSTSNLCSLFQWHGTALFFSQKPTGQLKEGQNRQNKRDKDGQKRKGTGKDEQGAELWQGETEVSLSVLSSTVIATRSLDKDQCCGKRHEKIGGGPSVGQHFVTHTSAHVILKKEVLMVRVANRNWNDRHGVAIRMWWSRF